MYMTLLSKKPRNTTQLAAGKDNNTFRAAQMFLSLQKATNENVNVSLNFLSLCNNIHS